MQIINSKVATSSGTHRAFLVQMEQFTQTETWRSMIPASSSTIILSNCTVNKTTYNRNLVTQNTVTKSFILALNHISTQNCHSRYDYAGYLIPIIQTPYPLKKPQRRHINDDISSAMIMEFYLRKIWTKLSSSFQNFIFFWRPLPSRSIF